MSSGFVFATIGINSAIGIGERVFQIIYYCKKDFKDYLNVKKLDLTFIILPAAIHFFIFLMYFLLHNEPNLTIGIKIKNFIVYLISSQFLFPIGIQSALKNKFYEGTDYSLIILRVLNGIHVFLVSVPQMFIVIINSLATNAELKTLEIICICFSSAFIAWSIVFYFLCNIKEEDYDTVIYEFALKI